MPIRRPTSIPAGKPPPSNVDPWIEVFDRPSRRMIINPYSFPAAGGGGSAPTLIASAVNGSNTSSVTTSAIDTTGANFLIVVVVTVWGTHIANISDSKGNTWTYLTLYSDTARAIRLAYCHSPTVGSGHTFTGSLGEKNSLAVAAFDGVASSPFDVENGNTGSFGGSNTPLATGSVTPSQANSLLIAGLGTDEGSSADISIDAGFTIAASIKGSTISGNGPSCGLAYKILTSSAANNPSWTLTSNPYVASATIAGFKY